MRRMFIDIKKIAVIAALLLPFCGGLYAQGDGMYISGPMTVRSGETVQWYGNVELAADTRIQIEDGGSLVFYGTNLKADPGAQISGVRAGWGAATNGSGTGKIVFLQPNPNGGTNVQQTIDGGYSDTATQNTFTAFEISNSNDVLLVNTRTRVGSDILFTAGHLVLAGNDVLLSDSATLTNYTTAKYVVTNGNGHLVKENFTAGFVFPVGMAVADYTPATITPSASNTVYVRVTDSAGAAGRMSGNDGMNRAWHIYAMDTAGAVVSLQHNSSTNQSAWDAAANFVTRYGVNPNLTGDMTSIVLSPWQSNTPGASSAVGGAGTETRSRTYASLANTPTANETWFSKASNVLTPLPLELVSFTASNNNCNAQLYWTTGGVDDGYGINFIVERSTDGSNFTTIATIATKQGTNAYRYIDTDPSPQQVDRYYRLRLQRVQGTYSYSDLLRVYACNANGAEASFYIQPNPVVQGQQATLVYTGARTDAYYTIYAADGALQQRSAPISIGGAAGSYQVSVGQFSPGTYVVTLFSVAGKTLGQAKLIVR